VIIQEAAWSFSSAQYHVLETPKSFVPNRESIPMQRDNKIPLRSNERGDDCSSSERFECLDLLVKTFVVPRKCLSLVVHRTALFFHDFLRFVLLPLSSHSHTTASLLLLPPQSVQPTAVSVSFPLIIPSLSPFPYSRHLDSRKKRRHLSATL
jgi:hypothetical protein